MSEKTYAVPTGKSVDPSTLSHSNKGKAKGKNFRMRSKKEAVPELKDSDNAVESLKSESTPSAKQHDPQESPSQRGAGAAKNKLPSSQVEHTATTPIDSASPAKEAAPIKASAPVEELNFADMLGEYSPENSKRLSIGDAVEVRIEHIDHNFAFCKISPTQEGTLELAPLDDEMRADLEVGNTIKLYIAGLKGAIQLSTKLAAGTFDFDTIQEAYASQAPVEAQVVGHNTGGLELKLLGTRGFCPMSQIDTRRVEDASLWVGKTLEVSISEVKENGKQLVCSRRKLLDQKRNQLASNTLSTLAIGDTVDGSVERFVNGGTLISFEGLEGFLPNRELAHQFVSNPENILAPLQNVRCSVLEIEPNEETPWRSRVLLTRKALLDHPFDKNAHRLVVGNDVQGRVVRLSDFGAFIELFEQGSGIEGLAHISKLSDKRVEHPSEVLKEGQEVNVYITDIDRTSEKVSLSLVKPMSDEEREAAKPKPGSIGATFKGQVVRIENYGIFIENAEGARLLVPKREIDIDRNADLRKAFAADQEVEAIIINIDEQGRASGSIKEIARVQERAVVDAYTKDAAKATLGNFGDLFKNIKL